jgi:hypothetical protein
MGRLKICPRCQRTRIHKGFKLCGLCSSRYTERLRDQGIPLAAKHKQSVRKDEKSNEFNEIRGGRHLWRLASGDRFGGSRAHENNVLLILVNS